MTIVCPHTSPSLAPTARATMSLAPPGANGTTKRTGFTGYVCAVASWFTANAKANSAAASARSAIRQLFHDRIQFRLRLEANTWHIRHRHIAVNDGRAIGKTAERLKNVRIRFVA